MNFNNFPNALLTLFALLIVNNWFIIVQGVVATSSPWARAYFISFFVMGVMVALNLVMAIVVEGWVGTTIVWPV